MNKRFRKLAEQARAEEYSGWLGGKPATTVTLNELERFAQLIVRECASKIGENFAEAIGSHASAHNTAVKQCQQTILEHFGVER